MENVLSSAESRLKPDHKIQLSHAAGVVQPAGSESKQGPNTRTESQAESLLAAEKRTLEMIADGASLEDILNDLCCSSSYICLAPIRPINGFWLYQFMKLISSEGVMHLSFSQNETQAK